MSKLTALWERIIGPQNTAAAPKDESNDSHDTVKATFVNWTATIVPFGLGILLAISNGYFFAGFHDFNASDPGNLVAWGSGFFIEAATLAAVFNASLRLKAGDKRGFRSSLIVGVLLALISFTAQYVFLQMSMVNGSLAINDSAVDKMPLFSALVGVGGFQGHDVLFLIRASAYHVAEFACTFLIAGKGLTHAKKLEKQRQSFEFSMADQQQAMVLSFMSNFNTNMGQMMAAQQRLMNQQFVEVQESFNRPVPRVEGPDLPALRKLLEATESPLQTTSELQIAEAVAQALDERSKKAKALWAPQPQPQSQNQGPVE